MQIHIHIDSTVSGHAPLTTHTEAVVNETLGRFNEDIARVEVHLSTLGERKKADGEFFCLMVAKIVGHQPLYASEAAISAHQAIRRAAERLKRAVNSTFDLINGNVKNVNPISDAELREGTIK